MFVYLVTYLPCTSEFFEQNGSERTMMRAYVPKKMIKLSLVVLASSMLASCDKKQISIDTRFAHTDRGYLNSAQKDIGDVYILNLRTGAMTYIDRIDVQDSLSEFTFTEVRARHVAGVALSGEISKQESIGIKAHIQSAAEVSIGNATERIARKIYTSLSESINSGLATNDGFLKFWMLDELSKPGSDLRLVVSYRTIEADSFEIRYNNQALLNGSISVPYGDTQIEVNFIGINEETWKGSKVPMFIDYYVIEVSTARNQKGEMTYQFSLDLNLPNEFDLSESLRGSR